MYRDMSCKFGLLAALVAALPAVAAAQGDLRGEVGGEAGGAAMPASVAALELLPGWRTDRGTHMIALHVRLAPGWKTYWRAPGEGGIPPRFGWEGSRNLASVEFHWPRPEVYEINGKQSIGYYDELVLPIELTLHRAGEPVEVRAMVELGVCEDVCVPMEAEVAVDLAGRGGPDPRIADALADQPLGAPQAGVRGVACAVEPIADGLRLTATIDMPAIGRDEVAVFEMADQSIWVSAAMAARQGDRFTATADLVPAAGAPFLLDRSAVRLTVLGDGRAVEMAGCPAGG